MKQLFKTVLIWLVALSVPAQGMAAVSMLHCGPGHQGAQSAQSMAQTLSGALPPAHEHPAHGHEHHSLPDVDAVSDSGHNGSLANAAGVTETGQTPDTAKVAASTQHKCSACASCCAAMALPSREVMPAQIDAARDVIVSLTVNAASVVIDGLERPPRTLRA